MSRAKPRVLLLTPPFVQTNCPYPATMHLTGFLRARGFAVFQRDLSIKVALDVLRRHGDETTDELIELLQGEQPPEAKLAASRVIDALALAIRDEIDPDFGFSRYAERIGAAAADFDAIERRVRRRGVIDAPLARRLEEAVGETRPTVVGVTCPVPGTLVAAFKIARLVRRRWPRIRLVLGGGFVSTELRDLTDTRVRRYFDDLIFDEGYLPWLKLLAPRSWRRFQTPGAFVRPSYDGIDWSEYFDVVETENPMLRMWSVGRWRKLVMARGCYWHRCAFCDVRLDYIGRFEQPKAVEVVDAMESLGRRFHFVDEAMPPALAGAVSREILRRGLRVEWWGNIRFDAAFTPELAMLMAEAGCVAVTGGLECANDRLLALMNKGVTLARSRTVLEAFRAAGVMVHAYLMYGFPTETEEEAFAALDYVRGLFRDDLIQSAFWHRFALTVHSPMAADPGRFGIGLTEEPPVGRHGRFCRNEIDYVEPGAPDWGRIGKVLELALCNYQEGRALGKRMGYWRRLARERAV